MGSPAGHLGDVWGPVGKTAPRYAASPHRRPAVHPSRPCTHVGVSPRELDASRVPGLVPTRYQACPGSPQRPDDPRTSNLSTQVPAMAPGASCAILRQVYGMVPSETGPVCHMGTWAAPRERGPLFGEVPGPVPAVPGLRLRACPPGLRDARSPAAGLPGAGGVPGIGVTCRLVCQTRMRTSRLGSRRTWTTTRLLPRRSNAA